MEPSCVTEDDALLGNVELVRGAPIRVWEWLLPPVLVGLLGAAGTVALVTLARQHDLRLAGWLLGIIAVSLLPFAVLLGWAGLRAYRTLSEGDVRVLVRIRILGIWGFSVALLVAGIVGGVFPVTLFGVTFSESLALSYGARIYGQDSEVAHVLRRLRPALIVECLFTIVIPPAVALIATTASLSESRESQYVADGIVIPVAGALALVILLRSRRPATRQGRPHG
jgi:hypothetical protein